MGEVPGVTKATDRTKKDSLYYGRRSTLALKGMTMRTKRAVYALAAATLAGVTGLEAQAKHSINLALVTPIQLQPAEDTISGFRFNLIYGRNAGMSGLDIGLANHVAGPMHGVQFGAVNMTDSGVGFQWGLVNLNEGEFEGFQWGWYNQAGLNNGLQLGFVNYAQKAKGIQVGIINIIKEGGRFPIMIIANWGKSSD